MTNDEAIGTEAEDDIGSAHTSEMDEKILAFEHLNVYASTMKADFQEWLSPSMRLSLEALTFKHSADVREVSREFNLIYS
jgi:hypothetical protein